MKQGCPKCKFENSRLNLDNFIKKSIEKHGNKYDYSKIIDKSIDTNIERYVDSNSTVLREEWDNRRI